ncbi:MAG: (2Fe-2S)-binding protein [Polyangiaceae bacterium]|nr:(2Fe-2S)-binding protein [Polyangiaceae bacterium]
MYVCICMAVTEQDIRDAAASGLCTPMEVMEKTGAGTRCGTCRPTIATLIDGKASTEASAGPSTTRRFRTYSAGALRSA